ncbi:MAG TPA: hypothetical protein VGI39_12885 [Polyangiaceae bacterium]|jgi:hypothetical protein
MRRIAAVLPLAGVVVVLGCSRPQESFDAGGNPAALVLDAQPPGPPPVTITATNVDDVARFPDEAKLHGEIGKIADAQVAARNSVPSGSVVAMLRLGTPVTQVSRHDAFLLCQFADPKNPQQTLLGWIGEQAFIPGPTVPRKLGCPRGQSLLEFDEQDFCGRVCRSDADCTGGLVCTGRANTVVSGKPGPEVSTCTMTTSVGGASGSSRPSGAAGDAIEDGGHPAPLPTLLPAIVTRDAGADSAPRSGRSAVWIRVPQGPMGMCPDGYVSAIDHFCHKACPGGDSDCPIDGLCTPRMTADQSPVCVFAPHGRNAPK